MGLGLAAVALCPACRSSEPTKGKVTPIYSAKTGKLEELTLDRNGDGRVDTWALMDGVHLRSIQIDRHGTGKPDRWEYYTEGTPAAGSSPSAGAAFDRKTVIVRADGSEQGLIEQPSPAGSSTPTASSPASRRTRTSTAGLTSGRRTDHGVLAPDGSGSERAGPARSPVDLSARRLLRSRRGRRQGGWPFCAGPEKNQIGRREHCREEIEQRAAVTTSMAPSIRSRRPRPASRRYTSLVPAVMRPYAIV